MYTESRGIRRAIAGLACLATALLPVMGITGARAAPNEQGTRSLDVAISQSVDTFNPYMQFFSIGYTINGLAYDSLMDWSAKDFSPEPALATEWKSSPDKLTWTFTIRKGVKFTDGEPLTAEDVEFTFHTMMTNPDARASSIDLVQNFESVDAPDKHTFVVRLKQPTSQMLALDMPILPKHIWKKHLDDLGKFRNFDFPLVGTGPFQVVEFETDQFIRLKANEEYWDGAPAYDELVFRYYKTPDAAVSALQSGEVDLVGGLTPAQYEALKGQPGIEVNRGQGRRVHSVTFNVGARTKAGKEFGNGHPALKDPKLRQAMHHAINKQELIEKVDGGMATEGVSYIPPLFSKYFWKPDASERVEFDIDRANQILDKAGYERGKDGIRVDPESGRPLRFRLLNHSDTPSESTDAKYLEEWWKQIGIAIEHESKDSGKLNDALYLGEYDIIFSGWGVDPDPTSILALYTCGALPEVTDGTQRNTDTFYCNPEYDKLHIRQKKETDPERRAELVREMQQILYYQAPEITIRVGNTLEAYRSDRWTGFREQPAEDGMITGQMGHWSYLSAQPVEKKTADSSNPAVLIGGVAAVVVVGAIGAFVAVRRRQTAGERE